MACEKSREELSLLTEQLRRRFALLPFHEPPVLNLRRYLVSLGAVESESTAEELGAGLGAELRSIYEFKVQYLESWLTARREQLRELLRDTRHATYTAVLSTHLDKVACALVKELLAKLEEDRNRRKHLPFEMRRSKTHNSFADTTILDQCTQP